MCSSIGKNCQLFLLPTCFVNERVIVSVLKIYYTIPTCYQFEKNIKNQKNLKISKNPKKYKTKKTQKKNFKNDVVCQMKS